MTEPDKPTPTAPLSEQVDPKVARKLKARREQRKTVWFGLGLFGLVGWSVAAPTILGVALGVWVDRSFPGRFSWTLMFMVGGLALGCLNAWYWLNREGEG